MADRRDIPAAIPGPGFAWQPVPWQASPPPSSSAGEESASNEGQDSSSTSPESSSDESKPDLADPESDAPSSAQSAQGLANLIDAVADAMDHSEPGLWITITADAFANNVGSNVWRYADTRIDSPLIDNGITDFYWGSGGPIAWLVRQRLNRAFSDVTYGLGAKAESAFPRPIPLEEAEAGSEDVEEPPATPEPTRTPAQTWNQKVLSDGTSVKLNFYAIEGVWEVTVERPGEDPLFSGFEDQSTAQSMYDSVQPKD